MQMNMNMSMNMNMNMDMRAHLAKPWDKPGSFIRPEGAMRFPRGRLSVCNHGSIVALNHMPHQPLSAAPIDTLLGVHHAQPILAVVERPAMYKYYPRHTLADGG